MNVLEWARAEENGFFRRELDGGVRLVGQRVPGRRSVALGVWIQVGSRDEERGAEGTAHFIEHLVFKGTAGRGAREIAETLERVGGSLDAFTTKDVTCFYARVLEEHLDLAADVLGDLVSRPRFDPHDVELERGVVLEELRTALDVPEDLIGELAQRYLWPEDTLGASILGTKESLAGLTPASVTGFHRREYRAPHTVVCAAGAVDPDRVESLVRRHLTLPAGLDPDGRQPPRASRGTMALHAADLSQLHLALITEAPGEEDPTRRAAQLLADILGGGMSSRLFQTVREEDGLAYSIQAYTEHFEDTGLLGISLAAAPDRAEAALTRTVEELERLRTEGLEPGELEGAKAQVRGSFVMGLESLTSRMSHLARGEFRHGGHQSVEDVLREFEEVTEEDIRAAAARLLDPAVFNLIALGPAHRDRLAFRTFERVLEVAET